jgi:hypothetical protein
MLPYDVGLQAEPSMTAIWPAVHGGVWQASTSVTGY